MEIRRGEEFPGSTAGGMESEERIGLVPHTQGQERGGAEEVGKSSSEGLMGLPRVVLLMFLISSSVTLILGLFIGVVLAPSLRPSFLNLLTLVPAASPASASFPSSTASSSGSVPGAEAPPLGLLSTISPSTPTFPGSGRISFLVVGDWGRDGLYNQSAVAQSMGVVAEAANSSMVVSTGDNFYKDGLAHAADPQFHTSFSSIYSSPSLLRLNWYSVLGNHDYRRSAAAQTGPGLRARDRRWHCSRSFQLRLEPPCPGGTSSSSSSSTSRGAGADGCTPLLELFFIDSTPLVLAEWGPGGQRGGARLNFSDLLPDHATFTTAHLSALREALAASDARWKVVVGHHPVRSVGTHGDTPDLILNLQPLLEEHGVDAYINGHDHSLQFIKRDDSLLYFVTSGAGSQAYRPQRPPLPDEGVLFDYNGQGFVNVLVERSSLEFVYHDVYGNVVFSYTCSKA